MRIHQTEAMGGAVLALSLFCVFASPASPQPLLFFVSPQEVVEEGAGVVLIAEYYADGVGVDPSTFTASLDGVPVEYLCSARDKRVECVPLSPAPGAHRLVISIADLVGNRAEASIIFERHAADADRDDHEPLLSVAVPARGAVFRDATVKVSIGYLDDLSGIDLGSLTLHLNGVDILDQCSPPTGLGLDCRLEDLAPGDYLLEVSIADLAGHVAMEEVPFLRLPIPEGDVEPPKVNLRLHQRPTRDQTPFWDLVFSDSESGVMPQASSSGSMVRT